MLLCPAKRLDRKAAPIQSSDLICLPGRDKREGSKTPRECPSNSRTPIQSDRYNCSPAAGLCTQQAATFHLELTEDTRVHETFLCLARAETMSTNLR